MIFFGYLITNRVNGRQYVGISKNPRARWREHKKRAGKTNSTKQLLHLDIIAYGHDAFDLELLACAISEQTAYDLEKILIEQCRTFIDYGGYNMTRGGLGSLGRKFGAESLRKRRESRANFKHSEETKAKISASHKGQKRSAETRQKMVATWARRREAAAKLLASN